MHNSTVSDAVRSRYPRVEFGELGLGEVGGHPYVTVCQNSKFLRFVVDLSNEAYRKLHDISIKNSPDRGLRSSPQLDTDLVESHIVVNDSSISNVVPSFIEIGRSRFLANFEVT